MFSCRAAWQRCGPLVRRAAYRLPQDGECHPKSQSDRLLPPQAYNTVISDHERFNDRIAELKARPKTEWVPKPWPPKSKYSTSATSLLTDFLVN
uniref:Uncharacterized protein n=1 Tax=Acanthochromis polyacanthus TaxID=80966 RepID=A0A3Q1HQC3_9TELE